MRPISRLLSQKIRAPKTKAAYRTRRPQLEVLEDRYCPTAIVFAGFVPGTGILNISEIFNSDTPSGGPGASLTLSGNTAAGGGVTSMITVQGGPNTTINGLEAVTFTLPFWGAIGSINVMFLNDNDRLVVGTPTGILNLPGTTLNVMAGAGNDTFAMGTLASDAGPAVNNVLSGVNWMAANLTSTGTESVSIVNAVVNSINVQQNSGANDAIQVWGVTANGQVNLNQNNGPGDTISTDQLAAGGPVVPPSPAPNLVPNSGFETGDFTNWSLSGNPSSSFVSSNAGSYSPHTGADFAALGTNGSLGALAQSFATTIGTPYTLSFWYASNGFGTNELKASINGVTAFDRANIPSTLAANAGQNGYAQFTTTFTATSTSTVLQFGERDDLSYLALDDVSVHAIVSPPGPVTTPALVTTSQGSGSNDVTSINRSVMGTYTGLQGNGDGDGLFLGTGVTVGAAGNGSVFVGQGTGSGDYVGVADLRAGVTTLVQQDLATNATGDTVGGVATNDPAPANLAGFPAAGVDRPSAGTTATLVKATGATSSLATVPTDGFASAVLQALNVTQGAAAGDVVALVQLPTGATTSESLTVNGTITIVQQDLAGFGPDFVVLGSYTSGAGPFANPPTGSPPYPWSSPLATGSITAANEVVTQGDATGDVLSVLFNTATSSGLASQFTQGNGGDQAIFQVNTAAAAPFNYTGGNGGNYVQADSNNVAGTFDGGSNVAANVPGQDNNNPSLMFVDFGAVIFA